MSCPHCTPKPASDRQHKIEQIKKNPHWREVVMLLLKDVVRSEVNNEKRM